MSEYPTQDIADISAGKYDAENFVKQSAPKMDLAWFDAKQPLIDKLLEEEDPTTFQMHIQGILGQKWKKQINAQFGNENTTLLLSAASWPNPKLVKFLLENGADPNVADIYGNKPNVEAIVGKTKGGRRKKTRSRNTRRRRTLRRKQ